MATNVTLGVTVEKSKLNIVASQCHGFHDEQQKWTHQGPYL